MMKTYMIQYGYNDGGEWIRERDTYHANTTQEAVDQCRNDHTGPLWDQDNIKVEHAWMLVEEVRLCVIDWE